MTRLFAMKTTKASFRMDMCVAAMVAAAAPFVGEKARHLAANIVFVLRLEAEASADSIVREIIEHDRLAMGLIVSDADAEACALAMLKAWGDSQ